MVHKEPKTQKQKQKNKKKHSFFSQQKKTILQNLRKQLDYLYQQKKEIKKMFLEMVKEVVEVNRPRLKEKENEKTILEDFEKR